MGFQDLARWTLGLPIGTCPKRWKSCSNSSALLKEVPDAGGGGVEAVGAEAGRWSDTSLSRGLTGCAQKEGVSRGRLLPRRTPKARGSQKRTSNIQIFSRNVWYFWGAMHCPFQERIIFDNSFSLYSITIVLTLTFYFFELILFIRVSLFQKWIFITNKNESLTIHI